MAIQQSPPADPALGHALIEKAERRLRWARTWQAEFAAHARQGRLDDAERVLLALFGALADVHDALLDATWNVGARALRAELVDLRRSDALLAYALRARHADGRVLVWERAVRPHEVTVVDLARAKSWTLLGHPLWPGRDMEFLLRYLFAAPTREALASIVEADPMPLAGRAEACGVVLKYAPGTLRFGDVDTREADGQVLRLAAPARHLGQPLAPGAETAVDAVLAFYDAKLGEIRTAARAPRSATPPSRATVH